MNKDNKTFIICAVLFNLSFCVALCPVWWTMETKEVILVFICFILVFIAGGVINALFPLREMEDPLKN
jgi:hypothetical protein